MAKAQSGRTPRIRDLQTLKAVTHPLRVRLYELLVTRGPATATLLAKRTEAAIGRVSYHLHQLARHGFTEEAPELARDNRERWWRAVPGGTSWDDADFADLPEADTVAEAAYWQLVDRWHAALRDYRLSRRQWSREWQSAAWTSDTRLRLTPDELREFSGELQEVVRRWAERTLPLHDRVPSEEPDDAREDVYFFGSAFPYRP